VHHQRKSCAFIPFQITAKQIKETFSQVKTGKLAKQPIPYNHAKHLCVYHEADQATVASAIDGALAAKSEWENMPWNDRAAIFLKAADLVSGKYRYKLMAATILGQGKNAWQAEIDAAAEVCVQRSKI
jgi:1-pyrroline-5-carboxylate dehydrogenase